MASAQAACRPADGVETLGFAAAVLVASRYNGGEPVLTASPTDSGQDGLTFASSGPWDEAETCAAFLRRMDTVMDGARRHQPCSLDRVGTGLGLTQAEQQRAFLQLGYVCGPVGAASALRDRAGILIRVEPGDLDVTVEVGTDGTGLPLSLVPQLAAHIARAMEWLSLGGDTPLRDFDVLSVEERQQITRVANGEGVLLPAGQTLHGLIAVQAARTPEAVAVVHNDVALTYRAFEGQANHLATVLRRDFRVTTGACVGVMMARSEQAIVALYAVMKAGAAYVPINPRHPWETIRYMVENAGISVLIVDSESIAAAASFAGDLLVVDIELRGAPEAPEPPDTATDSDLAYVIYTSGSTGKPKGVAVEHRAIVNTILWRNTFYGIGPSDINLQIPSFAFDSSVVDIFCVLTVGGTLVVPDEDLRLDAQHLLELSAARGVTSCIVTPSYYTLLLTELAGAVPSLRCVTLAGESATPDLVARHLTSLPGVALFNEYGPTENAVCSTACRIDVAEPTISIGRPIWNVTVVILDAANRLVPIGVPGEIYLGGAGVARGYVNQDALTAERFVTSPVADVCAGTLYKTGDRGCWRPDGSLEFLGRLDSQVKVRGVRIEVDEVEQALRRHPGVKSGAVVCKEDAGGAKYLAAYAEGQPGLTRAELRAHMAAQLPSYMVPDAFTVLPQLPLNLNGKIDRVALAGVDDFGDQAAPADVPLSALQQHLLGLWADVLRRTQVALDDNFFTMGGNSLRVMELTSRIRGDLSLGVELLDVYTYPTVREMADRLERTPQ